MSIAVIAAIGLAIVVLTRTDESSSDIDSAQQSSGEATVVPDQITAPSATAVPIPTDEASLAPTPGSLVGATTPSPDPTPDPIDVAFVMRDGSLRVWANSDRFARPWVPERDGPELVVTETAGAYDRVAFLTDDGGVREWDLRRPRDERIKTLWNPPDHSGETITKLEATDSETMMLSSDDTIYVSDRAGIRPVWESSGVVDLAATESRLFVAVEDRVIEIDTSADVASADVAIWSLDMGAEVAELASGEEQILVTSIDGSVMLLGLEADADEDPGPEILWDTSTGREPAVAVATTQDRYFFLLPSGDIAATDKDGLEEVFWDVTFSGAERAKSISSRGGRLVILLNGGGVVVYDVAQGLTLHAWKVEDEGAVPAVAVAALVPPPDLDD